jgi:hypothetical protein
MCVEVHNIFIIKQISRVAKHKSDSSIAQTNIKKRSWNSKQNKDVYLLSADTG